jgi:hypothetical protein
VDGGIGICNIGLQETRDERQILRVCQSFCILVGGRLYTSFVDTKGDDIASFNTAFSAVMQVRQFIFYMPVHSTHISLIIYQNT